MSLLGSDFDHVRVTRGIRNLIIGVVGLVALLIAVSPFVPVEEVARARGEFIPVQRVQVIQTPEGGALEAILVRNDQRVEKGQVLAQFRGGDIERDLSISDVRIERLRIEIERLDAFAERREPNLEKYRAGLPAMVEEATALYRQQTLALTQDLEQRDQAIAKEKATLASVELQIPSARESMSATKELRSRTQEGANKGIIARNRVAQAQEQAAQAERIYIELVSSIDELKAQINSLEAERAALEAKAASDARKERAERSKELDETLVARRALQTRSADIEVKAPISGIVQKVSETPIGTVIAAGGVVCEIVPTEGGVLMEARVAPRDIGFVRVGQDVLVKADTFDYGRFGAINGKVARISPSSHTPVQGQEPFFGVEIELMQEYVGTARTHVVSPGMTGEASILTGSKTVFQYLLKPIYTTLDTAMHER